MDNSGNIKGHAKFIIYLSPLSFFGLIILLFFLIMFFCNAKKEKKFLFLSKVPQEHLIVQRFLNARLNCIYQL